MSSFFVGSYDPHLYWQVRPCDCDDKVCSLETQGWQEHQHTRSVVGRPSAATAARRTTESWKMRPRIFWA